MSNKIINNFYDIYKKIRCWKRVCIQYAETVLGFIDQYLNDNKNKP